MKTYKRRGRRKVAAGTKHIATAVTLPPEMLAFLENRAEQRHQMNVSAAIREGVELLMKQEGCKVCGGLTRSVKTSPSILKSSP
jgi:hypothetical protein